MEKLPEKGPVGIRSQLSNLWANPEFVLSNMATSWFSKAGTAIPEFVLGKFPYIQALSLIMLLAERALKLEKYPPMHPYIIYTVAGVCFLAGCMMSARIKVKSACLLYALVLGYLTFNAYTNRQFNYSRHVRNRISSRHLGCLGVYLIYSVIKDSKQSKLVQRVGELCIAVFLLGNAYLINESYEDRKALMEHIPGGNYARYAITVLYTCAGICFLSGYFLKDISMSMAFLVTLLTLIVDVKFSYWSYRGMAYWNQFRIVIDNVNMIAGFFLFMAYYENIAKEEKEAVERASEEEQEAADDSEDDHDKRE